MKKGTDAQSEPTNFEQESVRIFNKYFPGPVVGNLPGYEAAILEAHRQELHKMWMSIANDLPTAIDEVMKRKFYQHVYPDEDELQ